MPGTVVGSGEFILSLDQQQYLAEWARSNAETAKRARDQAEIIAKAAGTSVAEVKRAATQIAAEHKRAADAAVKEAERIAQAHARSSTSFGDGAKAAVGFGLALTGIAAGAAGLIKILGDVAEATQAQAQAQFAVNKLYGEAAPLVTANVEALAKASGRSKTEALEAAASVATLTRNYALTGDQIQKVLKISADLAAVRGISLGAAAERTASALRGEGEAIEYLGQALQSGALKSLADMTDEQRAHFETLSDITKAQIVLNALTKNTIDLQGTAAERANSNVGANDKLRGSVSDLAAALGKELTPSIAGSQGALADLADGFTDFIKRYSEFRRAQAELAGEGQSAFLGFDDEAIRERILANRGGRVPFQIGPDPGLPGAGAGPTPAQAQAIKDAENERRQREAKAADDLRAEVARRQKAIADIAEVQEKAAREEDKRNQDAIERRKVQLAVQQAAELKALEERERAAIRALEVERDATHASSEAAIKDAERRRDGEINAAEEAKAQALAAIKAREDELAAERELEDRALEDRRRGEDQALADTRKNEDERLTVHQQALAHQRELEDRARADRRAGDDQDRSDRRAAEDREVTEARAREDRKLEQQVQALAKRRQAEDRDLTDRRRSEDQGIAAARQAQDRGLQAAHDAELARLEETHKARLAAIDQEIEGITTRKEADLKALDEQADAARAAAETTARALAATFEAASRKRDADHQAVLRALDAEADAAKAAAEQTSREREAGHVSRLRDLDAEAEAARAASDQELRDIAARVDAAERAHDRALAGIDAEKDAEADRHRAAMAFLDDEQRRRQDAIDQQLAALDALDRAEQQASQLQGLQDKIAAAQFGVQRAESTGNQSEIDRANRELLAAQQALLGQQTKNARDAARQQLQDQKSAIADEIAARKDAEGERDRLENERLGKAKDAADAELKLAQDAATGEKQAVQDTLSAQLAAIDVRKQAESDAYDLVRQQAADNLTRTLGEIDTRKLAEQDAYEAQKQAAQDAFNAAKQQGQDALDAILVTLQKRKDAVAAEADAAIGKLKERQSAENDAYQKDVERINLRFSLAQTRLSDQRKAEDQALADSRLAQDRERDDHRTKEDTKLTDAKKRLSDRRTAEDLALSEGRKSEDRTIAESRLAQDRRRLDERTAEDRAAQEANTRRADQRRDEDRVIADRRLAEDRERQDRRTAEDKALSVQRAAVEASLQVERRQIDEHYNGAQGVLTLLRKAMSDADAAYAERLRLAKLKFDEERDALNAVYRNPAKTGLLDLQDEAAKNSRDRLTDQLADIAAWKGAYTDALKDAKKSVDELDNAVRNLHTPPGIPRPGAPGSPGGPLGPPAPPGFGGGPAPTPPPVVTPTPGPGMGEPSTGEVNVDPDRFATSFGFLARYTHPFNPRIPNHRGVDLVVKGAANGGKGLPVGAFRGGSVYAATIDPNGGNGITIRAADGLYDRYFHFDKLRVGYGDPVKRGQWIGDLGETGTEGSPHLHYEISRNGNRGDFEDEGKPLINPVPYMRGYAMGGWITRPSVISDELTGQAYARAGEGWRPEYVGPVNAGSGVAGGPALQRIDVDITWDNQTKKRLIFEGISLNVRAGDIQEIRR